MKNVFFVLFFVLLSATFAQAQVEEVIPAFTNVPVTQMDSAEANARTVAEYFAAIHSGIVVVAGDAATAFARLEVSHQAYPFATQIVVYGGATVIGFQYPDSLRSAQHPDHVVVDVLPRVGPEGLAKIFAAGEVVWAYEYVYASMVEDGAAPGTIYGYGAYFPALPEAVFQAPQGFEVYYLWSTEGDGKADIYAFVNPQKRAFVTRVR